MKIKLDEELIEESFEMHQLNDQLHHQLVSRHQESPSANTISVDSQTNTVGIIEYVLTILQIHQYFIPSFSKYVRNYTYYVLYTY